MKVLIIEDEPLAAKNLEQQLFLLENDIIVAGKVKSVSEGKEWLQQHEEPDLIFADIQLSDGISFEIFESQHVSSPVIFTTAYDEYAIKAFKLNSVDYLLKPIDRNELQQAVDKYQKHFSGVHNSEQLKHLLQDLSHPEQTKKKYKERFMVMLRSGLMPLPVKEIAYFTKDELIYAVTFENKRYVCDCNTLDEVEQMVDPQIFYRANRQFIVHIDTINQIKSTHKGITINLKSPLNQEIDISREKAKEFKEWVS